MRRIETEADIAEGLAQLAKADPRLRPVIEIAGPVPLRRRTPGFDGLCEIVVSQQVSRASAGAIFDRLAAAIDLGHAGPLRAASDETLRGCGLSTPKIRTLRALADAVASGDLEIDRLAGEAPADAAAALTAVHGIGPWTAEIFLMFCLGHADIFPSADLALRIAVADAFSFDERPKPKALDAIAETWSPWRGVAARLFWAYYRACRQGRDAAPL